MELLKLAVIFILIVIALRRKISVGLTLFGAGLITAALFQTSASDTFYAYVDLLKSWRFISLTLLVILITFMGALLKELGYLEKMSTACLRLPGGARTAVPMLPALIGLMPMPGGSLLSAPLVNQVLSDSKYPPDLKMVSNYWFRHQVEFFWPVYAGIILTEGITGMAMMKVSIMQLPLSLSMLIIGYIFFIRKIDKSDNKATSVMTAIQGILFTIWPILLAIFLYGLVKINMVIAIVIAIILLMIVARPSLDKIKKASTEGLSIKIFLLIFGILSFQSILELTGAINSIPELAIKYNLPTELIIFLVCATIGLLTGMVSAYVGLGYALLAGFLYQNQINPGYIMLAYMSGFVGMMLSPTHLCLILTNDYFKSDLSAVYRRIFPPMLILFICGFLIYFSGWPELFK